MTDRVLIVDDDREMCRVLERCLGNAQCEAVSFTAVAEALAWLAREDADVIITDVRMPREGGLELCRRVQETRPDIPVVMITAFGTIETAIEAIRSGAYDFLVKPFELETVRIAVRRAVERRRLVRRVRRLEDALQGPARQGEMVGRSSAMQHVHELVARLCDVDTTVTITGESGTGKELVARAIHGRGARSGGPFVPINCAAMPASLLESELFGHVKGAFTDARADRLGLFAQASGGTIFLDEIGELPLELQPKILRALQERRVRPVGGSSEVPFDARVVTATNRDLEQEVEQGSFREDLFYRINVVEVAVPPLRARGNDILLLAAHFIARYASAHDKDVSSIVPAAAQKLLDYAWPGNVRELQNCIERAVTLCSFSELGVDDLPAKIRDFRPEQLTPGETDPRNFAPMEEIERRYVERVYAATGGNKSLAASILGFNRKTLYRKLRRYGLLPPES
ncbi:MAG: sigma-54-dependent transcriptional regulator [Nannocystaceae bacterium]|nr:sigma-54 dependent transcriptional regulator [bacterium]